MSIIRFQLVSLSPDGASEADIFQKLQIIPNAPKIKNYIIHMWYNLIVK